MDFEQALLSDGTVKLQEGLDVASLGLGTADIPTPQMSPVPTPARRATTSATTPRKVARLPATPVVVPPTPPNNLPIIAPTAIERSHPPSPSPASAQSNNNNDPDGDPEYNAKRRSLFRSPGTASSPDLATLVRKAKEKRNAMGVVEDDSPAASSSQLLMAPGGGGSGLRLGTPSAASSSYSIVSPSPSYNSPVNTPSKGKSMDWAGRSRTLSKDGGKSTKSMRNKTSSFFGKMLGSSTVRERQPTDPPPVTIPPPIYGVFSRTAQPLPPLPPISPPSLDVFTSPESSQRKKGSDEIYPSADHISPSQTSPDKPPRRSRDIKSRITSPSRRRSMSVGDLEWQKGVVSTPTKSKSPDSTAQEWERAISDLGLIGETSPLEIKDPSTPGRNPVFGKSSASTSSDRKRAQTDTTTPYNTPNKTIPNHASSLPVSPPLPPPSPNIRNRGDFDMGYVMTSPVAADLTIGSSRRPSTTTSDPRDPLSPPQSPILARGASAAVGLSPLSAGGSSRNQSRYNNPTPSSPRIPNLRQVPSPSRPNYPPSALPVNLSKATTRPRPKDGLGSPSHDSLRLRIQPRSAASNSEPALIPPALLTPDDDSSPGGVAGQSRTIRLVPSATSFGYSSASSNTAENSRDRDLTTEDLVRTRFGGYVLNGGGSGSASGADSPRSLPRRNESLMDGSEDMEIRGKELSQRCWNEDETFLHKEKIAEWLGGSGLINKVALRYYLDFFDFTALRLDHAFRRLCAKLFLKAETQQVDRILEEFGRRYWDCNPSSIFGSAGMVHAVAYSILLLNTDLHVAELASHMSRGQFVRNTLNAIQAQLQAETPGPTSTFTAPTTPLTSSQTSNTIRGRRSPTPDLADASLEQESNTPEEGDKIRTRIGRSSSVASWRSFSKESFDTPLTTPIPQYSMSTSNLGLSSPRNAIFVTSPDSARFKQLPTPATIHGRPWENEMESLLKDIYTSVKNQQILQPLTAERHSMSSLNPGSSHTLGRRPSQRGPDRLATLKRGSIRGLTSLLTGPVPGSSPYSSNSSIDGRISPSPSFVTSIGDGIPTSVSSLFTPTLGFASNLSNTIIREAQEDDLRSLDSRRTTSTDVSISDEELALLGPPWAKEGMLSRKQYWESHGKRAKIKTWMEVFVVIQKGELNMFTFGDGDGAAKSAVVGGGNWLNNAHSVGQVMLAHSLAHVLPAPGYNRQRPYCFVLTLASGAVYFFQAGTEDLVNEWVLTCNYWAARQSKEPLSGGVSNMEYGWNRVAEGYLDDDRESIERMPEFSDTISVRSGRGRLTKRNGPTEAATMRMPQSPYLDRVVIYDWKPPMAPSVPSLHDEETQMEALQKQVTSLKRDLKTHNDLQAPMIALYIPRSTNATKALANWERKSQYLLTELVKYDSYVDSLRSAMTMRLKKRGEKALEKALVASPDVDGFLLGQQCKDEGEDPTTPQGRPSFQHRREIAQADDG